MGETLRLLKEEEMDAEDICFSPEHLAALIQLQDSKAINGSVAKEVFEVMFHEDIDPVAYVEEKGLKTVNDEGALRKTVEEVIAANPQSVEDYRNGKESNWFPGGTDHESHEGKMRPGYGKSVVKGIAVKLENRWKKSFCDFVQKALFLCLFLHISHCKKEQNMIEYPSATHRCP